MTLAVAAKYPWGVFSELIKMGAQVSQAVILASDSRWTYGNRNIPYEDIGTKVFKLGKDCGAVYAGDAKAGEHSIKELFNKLARRKTPNFQRSLVLAENTFYRVYQYHKKQRDKQKRIYPLYVLVGICDTLGQASLIYFSSKNNFKPVFLTGVYGVGIEEARVEFEKEFKQEIGLMVRTKLDKLLKMPPSVRNLALKIETNAGDIAIPLVAKLEEFITVDKYKGIGGKIQCAMITKDGFQPLDIFKTTDPTNEGKGWTPATAKPEELTTIRKRFNLTINYQNVNKFGISQMCD